MSKILYGFIVCIGLLFSTSAFIFAESPTIKIRKLDNLEEYVLIA
jgi:hypothetical protein